jgi:hypothetical protein
VVVRVHSGAWKEAPYMRGFFRSPARGSRRVGVSTVPTRLPTGQSVCIVYRYMIRWVLVQSSDVLVLFALMEQEGPWTLRSLAARLGVQHSKVQRAVDRLGESGLYDAERRRVIPHAAEEFLDHALRYLDPVHLGPVARGVPTAWAATPLSEEIIDEGLPPVWPYPNGKVRGQSVTPLDARLPMLVESWPEVAELAALADALRLGDSRSRNAARKRLHDRIYPGS